MAGSTSIHIPVLLQPVLTLLDPQPGHILVDGTLGGGGHTRLFAQRVGYQGMVVAVDRDPAAVARAEHELVGMPIRVAQANYTDLPEILASAGGERVHGILLDLGLSSDQLADAQRGFSYEADGPLDLRFDPDRGEPAWRLLARLSAEHLANVIYQYGEERHSRRIAPRLSSDAAPRRYARPASWRTWSVAVCPAPGIIGLIRRRARSRHCVSP